MIKYVFFPSRIIFYLMMRIMSEYVFVPATLSMVVVVRVLSDRKRQR
jgi:hypothetical protein